MQQLLVDKAEAMNPSLLRGLFVQRLPSNVRMILASAAKGSRLLELTEMADGVMDIISPSIATEDTPQKNELGKLHKPTKWENLSGGLHDFLLPSSSQLIEENSSNTTFGSSWYGCLE